VVQSHSNKNGGASEWLSVEQIEEAADIVVSYDSLGSEAVISGALSIDSEAEVLVENVTQFNAYDSDSNTFSDEMEIWVRLTLDDHLYFAKVDLDEQSVVKLINGGEQ
jgi:dipeptidase